MSQRFFDGLLRAPDERFAATVPERFVEEVRLEAAAARFAGFAAVRAFEAVLRLADFTALRLEERAEAFEAERALDFAAAFFAGAFLAAVFLATAFLATAFFATVFLAAVFLAEAFTADLAAVFLAATFLAGAFLAVLLTAVFLATAFLATAFFAAVFLAPAFLAAVLFEADFTALLAAAFFAAVFLAAVLAVLFAADLRAEVAAAFLAAGFLAPAFAADFAPFLALVELRREEDFFAVFDLVLVAPVSPVNSMVSGLDLSSVGIAASFKGLRVQPSRLQGNVVIPSGFRLTDSVESRTGTISVDTFCGSAASTCAFDPECDSRVATRGGVAEDIAMLLKSHEVIHLVLRKSFTKQIFGGLMNRAFRSLSL